jgi:hypothetical protein
VPLVPLIAAAIGNRQAADDASHGPASAGGPAAGALPRSAAAAGLRLRESRRIMSLHPS